MAFVPRGALMISVWHIVIVVLIVLILIGRPERIANLGKALGQSIRGFKEGLNGERENKSDSKKDEQK